MEPEFEERAELFHQDVTREYYLVGSGQKEEMQIAAIYERYKHLFAREAVGQALADVGEKPKRLLAEFVSLEYMENLVKELSEEITNHLLKAKVEWDGQEVPYHNVQTLIVNEPKMSRRHDLDGRRREVTAAANPQRESRWQTLHAEAKGLGFSDYVALCDGLRALRLAWLAEEMKRLLAETEKVYFEKLGYFLYKIDVPEAQAATSDIAYLFRAPQFDVLFPKEFLVDSLRKTMQGMGIDIDQQSYLELDTDPRPLKSPRAFCAGIRIPQEVKLVIKPKGGQDDYASLFHEAGHAEHFVHVDPNLEFSYRRLGDNSVTESYAFLLQHLMHSPHWLKRILGVEEAKDFLTLLRFNKLWFLRRYSSKLLYELKLHSNGAVGADKIYVSTLGDNLGVTVFPENYLDDVDDAFYAAQYLRAWTFEVQHRRYLEGKFGGEWFANPEAGKHLARLWKRGQEPVVEEIAADLGYDGLDIDPLVEELIDFK
ncbi:MAG: hypothetical protein HYX86_04630 [Chloroflexi bacterium]|nr:hypothetical protein [Chloroflexota bacterium]